MSVNPKSPWREPRGKAKLGRLPSLRNYPSGHPKGPAKVAPKVSWWIGLSRDEFMAKAQALFPTAITEKDNGPILKEWIA